MKVTIYWKWFSGEVAGSLDVVVNRGKHTAKVVKEYVSLPVQAFGDFSFAMSRMFGVRELEVDGFIMNIDPYKMDFMCMTVGTEDFRFTIIPVSLYP